MKLNLAMLALLLTIMGLVWQGSAKLTQMETALEAVPELRSELRQVREDVIVLKAHDRESAVVQRSHMQSWLDEARIKR